MTDTQIFTRRAKTLKTIFLIMTLVLGTLMVFSISLSIWEMTPFSAENTYTISFHTNQHGNRLNTLIESDHKIMPYIQLTSNLMKPTDTFKVSQAQAVANITLIGTLVRIPILIGLWWTYLIFKILSTSRTPFEPELFHRIKKLGKLIVLYGFFGDLVFSLLLSIFVTGIINIMNPVNLYIVVLGFVLYVVAEIMVYGFGLQTEVDALL